MLTRSRVHRPALFLTFAAALFNTPTAMAQDESTPWYVKALGGVTSLSDADTSVNGGPADSAEFSSGAAFGGAVGYDFGALRLEGELLYRTNDVDRVNLTRAPVGSSGGDFSSLGFGVNLLYEVDLFGSDKARSYFGGGLVYLEEIDLDIDTPGGEVSYSDSDTGYQLIAGARYSVSEPWDIFAELRYFDAGSVTLDAEDGGNGQVKSDYENTSIMFGVGYRF